MHQVAIKRCELAVDVTSRGIHVVIEVSEGIVDGTKQRHVCLVDSLGDIRIVTLCFIQLLDYSVGLKSSLRKQIETHSELGGIRIWWHSGKFSTRSKNSPVVLRRGGNSQENDEQQQVTHFSTETNNESHCHNVFQHYLTEKNK